MDAKTYVEFIEKTTNFIEKHVRVLEAARGREGIDTKELEEQIAVCKQSLERLKEAKAKIDEVCAKVKNPKNDNSDYPSEINYHHIRFASIIGILSLLTVAGYLSVALGGTNMEAWPTSLPWISTGVGTLLGVAVGTPIYAVNRKRFDKAAVMGRKHKYKLTKALDREQVLLRKSLREHNSMVELDKTIKNSMDQILSGSFSLREDRYEKKPIKKLKFKGGIRMEDTGTTRTVKKSGFKEGYKDLPRRIRRQLDTALTFYNDEYEFLTDSCRALGNISSDVATELNRSHEPTRAHTEPAPVTTNEPVVEEKPAIISEVREDGSLVLDPDSYTVSEGIPVNNNSTSVVPTTPVLPPSNSNSNNNNNGGRR